MEKDRYLARGIERIAPDGQLIYDDAIDWQVTRTEIMACFLKGRNKQRDWTQK